MRQIAFRPTMQGQFQLEGMAMSAFSPRVAASVLALVLFAQSAPALTKEEAWAAFQAAASQAGQSLTTASTNTSGDTLTATDVSIAVAVPDGLAITTSLPTLAFRDVGDGSVEVIYPPSFGSTLTFPDGAADAPKELELTFTHDALSLVASGDAASPNYQMSAKMMSAMVAKATDNTGKPFDLTAVLAMTDLAGNYTMSTAAGGMGYDSAVKASSLALTGTGRDPSGFAADFSVAVKDLTTTAKGAMIDPATLQANLVSALAAGTMFNTSFATGPVAVSVETSGNERNDTISATFTSTSAQFGLDKTRMDYGFSLMGAQLAATGMDMPFDEVSSAFSEITFDFMIPVMASDTPQDFSFLMRFVDLTLTEEIWAIFDPTARLPRDPVSFILDLKGQGAWNMDILDPAANMAEMPDLPGRLYSLDLTQALVKAAGAQVVGVGAMTFDNTNLDAMGGYPAPTGKVTFTLTGINALIDALVAIGLVPEDEVMGVRMGLGMFARPGNGPDELISEVEFQNGALFINGQPM